MSVSSTAVSATLDFNAFHILSWALILDETFRLSSVNIRNEHVLNDMSMHGGSCLLVVNFLSLPFSAVNDERPESSLRRLDNCDLLFV